MIELYGVLRCFMSLLNSDALCFVMKISDHSESFQIKFLLA